MNSRSEFPFPKLGPKQQKGSKPRCHLLTTGPDNVVAARLTDLVGLDGVTVRTEDRWFPNGFEDVTEAQLGTEGKSPIADSQLGHALRDWWLSVPSKNANTPNWDIASACVINGKAGILLIEAKAHNFELRKEEGGKPLKGNGGSGVSINSRRNHVRIGAAIQEASLALSASTGMPWALSRDWNYQMSNRFAWAWKLTDLGVPVVLIYLGFLKAEEMSKGKQLAFTEPSEWERQIREHSAPLFPQSVWGKSINVFGTPCIPLIRTIEQPLSPVFP